LADGDATVFLGAPCIITGSNVEALKDLEEEIIRLRAVVFLLSFEPLSDSVTTWQQALHILGVVPGWNPLVYMIKAHFRLTTIIHHPDSGYGSQKCMSQINEAMDLLKWG
jgi:hypothetical protein